MADNDRFDLDDAAYAAKRRLKRLQADADAKAETTRALLEGEKDRLDAIAKGEPLPLPLPSAPVGPPPAGQFVQPKVVHPTTPVRNETVAKHYDHAALVGSCVVLPDGNVSIPTCQGITYSKTKASLLVASPNFSKDDWIALKGIHDDSDVYAPGTDGRLVVHRWFAQLRGWVSR